MNHLKLTDKSISILFILVIIAFVFFYVKGYDSSIGWNVTSTAESSTFYTAPFKKGPFEFGFEAQKYELAETFSAGPSVRQTVPEMALSLLIAFGICTILAVASFMSMYWFIAICGLFIFFVINIHFPEVRLLGFDTSSSVGVIILLAAYLIPLYIFHAYQTQVGLLWRIIVLLAITFSWILISDTSAIYIHDQFISGGYFGLVAISLLFLVLVAEEVIFGILFLITQSKGGQNNHTHFAVFSTLYLGIVIAFYGSKSGFWSISMPFFEPYGLLILSSIILLWSVRYKSDLLGKIIDSVQAKTLYSALGIISFSFLALSNLDGNDPVYEGYEYFIIYCHLSFGIMFFLYLIWNFISPLGQGLQVFKIAYKPHLLPYVSVRIMGILGVVGFFFLANKGPFLLFKAGQFNYQGLQAETRHNDDLAYEYFQEGSIYGMSNHFSNYKIGYQALQKNNIKEANYRFKKATDRYPSPQSFINAASTYAMLNQSTPNLVTLQEGLNFFEGNNALSNNLALTYAEMGKMKEAQNTLMNAEGSDSWTNANLVNLWKVAKADSNVAAADYQAGNLAVKANVLHNLLTEYATADIKFDSGYLYPAYPLHQQTYLINACYYFNDQNVAKHLSRALQGQLDESIYFAGRNAASINYFKSGNINRAVEEMEFLVADVPSRFQGKYLNQLGLMALSQHCLTAASDYFGAAAGRGHREAHTNQLVCFLEKGQFDAANSWMNYLISFDSGYISIKEKMEKLNQKENLSIDEQLFNLYYNYSQYSPAEVHALLANAETRYVHTLWDKISSEMLLQHDYKKLKLYRSLFNSFLDKAYFSETDLLIGLSENTIPKSNHQLIRLLKVSDSSERIYQLKEFALQNAFNEPMIFAICNILNEQSPIAAYDVLIKSININKSSIPLHKQYIVTALKSGLEVYAREGLDRLKAITNENDFLQFEKIYQSLKEELDAKTEW